MCTDSSDTINKYEQVPCPLCSSIDYRILHRFDPFKVVCCKDCGLTYLSPRACEEKVRNIYIDNYFASHRHQSYGYTDYFSMENDMLKTFRSRWTKARYYLGRKGRLIDIGCGFGYFLDIAKDYFRECWGVEISSFASNKVKERGFNIHQGCLEEAKFPDNYFDMAVMMDFFEHVYNPTKFLIELNRIMSPGGIVLITTPNINSLLARLSGKRWVSFKFPEHVAFYSPDVLTRLLRNSGFKVEKILSAGQYASIDFVVDRIRALNGLLGSFFHFIVRVFRIGNMSIYVNNGSMSIICSKK